MSELVRCTSCFGAKQVPKLGGIIGDCNTCNGEGKIKISDRVIPVVASSLPMTSDIINATAIALPVSDIDSSSIAIGEPHSKVDTKRVVYKRKNK